MESSYLPEKYKSLIFQLKTLAVSKPKVSRCRVIAGIIKRNKLFAFGTNSYNGGALSYRFKRDVFAVYEHAEVAAIKDFLKRYPTRSISSHQMIVVRVKLVNERWVFGCSKPCLGCQRAIKYFQMKPTLFLKKKLWMFQKF